MTTVREFSPAGPCLTIGRLVRQTAKFYVYNEWRGGDRFDVTEKRIGKTHRTHIEPCSSCRDHARTQYPHGLMD
jgi:hypothetical protein